MMMVVVLEVESGSGVEQAIDPCGLCNSRLKNEIKKHHDGMMNMRDKALAGGGCQKKKKCGHLLQLRKYQQPLSSLC